jgi:nitric oxide reductase NorQ protein
VGKFLLKGEETLWVDGPLTKAVKTGAICYLDEIVEARKDTTVLIHPLTDHRRFLPVDKTGKVIEAHENFLLVISYNPGYQSLSKDLKHSTRQRFLSIEFVYPTREEEAEIICRESGIARDMASELTKIGEKVRNMKGQALSEGVSTRLLIYAARLIKQGLHPKRACETAIGSSITDEPVIQKAIQEVISAVFTDD